MGNIERVGKSDRCLQQSIVENGLGPCGESCSSCMCVKNILGGQASEDSGLHR